MRRWALAIICVLSIGRAEADSGRIEVTGEVVGNQSRWIGEHRWIVTESDIRDDAGQTYHVLQYGGTLEGLSMHAPHMPPVLARGSRVRATLRRKSAGPAATYQIQSANLLQDADKGRLEFVQSENSNSGERMSWSTGCALISYHEDGTTHLEGSEEFEVLDEVMANWRETTEQCSYFEISPEGVTDASAGVDGVNLVRFWEQYEGGPWCEPGLGRSISDDGRPCFDDNAIAISTVTSIDATGEIIDVDIEYNAISYTVSNGGLSEDPTPECFADLSNTMTHEFGHLMGLDHTCAASAGQVILDDQGERIPVCSENPPPEVAATTMFNSQLCGEVTKATPEADDINAVCTLYSSAGSIPECRSPWDETGGCTCEATRPRLLARGAQTSAAFSAFVLFLLGAWVSLGKLSSTRKTQRHRGRE